MDFFLPISVPFSWDQQDTPSAHPQLPLSPTHPMHGSPYKCIVGFTTTQLTFTSLSPLHIQTFYHTPCPSFLTHTAFGCHLQVPHLSTHPLLACPPGTPPPPHLLPCLHCRTHPTTPAAPPHHTTLDIPPLGCSCLQHFVYTMPRITCNCPRTAYRSHAPRDDFLLPCFCTLLDTFAFPGLFLPFPPFAAVRLTYRALP